MSLAEFVRNLDSSDGNPPVRTTEPAPEQDPKKANGSTPAENSKENADCVDGPAPFRLSYPLDVILKHPEWGRFVQRTGKVIGVLTDSGSRVACGHLKLMPRDAWHSTQNQGYANRPMAAMFAPQDKRFPRLWIPAAQLPQNFFQVREISVQHGRISFYGYALLVIDPSLGSEHHWISG